MERSADKPETHPPEKRRKVGRPRVHPIKLVDRSAKSVAKVIRRKRKRRRPGLRLSRVKNARKNKLPPQLDKSPGAERVKANDDHTRVKVEVDHRWQFESGDNSKASWPSGEAAAKSDVSAENDDTTMDQSAAATTCQVKREVGGDNDPSELPVYTSEDTGEYTDDGLTMHGFESQEQVHFANADVPFEEMYFEESKPFVEQQLLQQSSLDPLSVNYADYAETVNSVASGKDRTVKDAQAAVGREKQSAKVISISKKSLRRISEVIFRWYEAHFLNGSPLTKFQVLEQTKELARCFIDHNVDSIYQSRWYDMWQQHHQMYKPLFGREREAPNESMASYYRKMFERRMETQKLQTHQLFCAQIFYLNYKTLPRKPDDVDAPCGKRSSDRLTVMACSNVDGTLRLPLLVVGKQPKTTIFGNTSPYLRPVTYLQHKSSLLNGRTLEWWFKAVFVEIVKKFLSVNNLPVRALLLFERYKSFGQVKKISDGEMVVEYLDTEVTRALHPMEVGIMDQIKKRYKMTFLKSVLCIQNYGVSMSDYLESMTLRQALFQLKDAWDYVSNENIFKCWSKLLPQYFFDGVDTALTNDITIQEFVDLMRKLEGYNSIDKKSVKKWIDSYEVPPPIPSFETLVEMVRNFNVQELNVPREAQLPISKPEAFYAVDTLLQFFQENLLVNPSDVDILKKIKYAIVDHTIFNPIKTAKT